METGTDGRFYDWHYDYNHNGKLEMNEYMDYEEVTFGKHNDSGGYRRRPSGGKSVWLALGFMIGVPLLTAISPIFGIILLVVLMYL